jgi:hypothetical protein
VFDRDRILTTSDGWITPLATWRATAEERDSALRPFQCSGIVRDLHRDGARHHLLALYRVATGMELYPPQEVSDHFVVAAIESAITDGRLILIPGGDQGHRGAGQPSEAGARETEQDRLVKSVMGDRADVEFERHRYRLVAADRWSRQVSEGDYRLVLEGQAREVVTRMVDALAKTPDERTAWQQLAAALTDRRNAVGILLLRHVPPTTWIAKPTDVPVAPPPAAAQAKVAPQDWIEIQIEYEDGSPFDGSCVVELPGGRSTEGPPDADGVVRIKGMDPGSCKLSFPALDATAWAPG